MSAYGHKGPAENKFVQFEIDSRILYVTFKENVHISHRTARTIVADRIRYQEGIPYRVICDVAGVKSSTKLARDYLAGIGSEALIAIAFVTPLRIQNIVGYYLASHVTEVPVKIFTSRQQALQFLRSF